MTFTIYGETPSKKNSRINTRSGRSFPNRRYVEWHDSAIAQIFSSHVERIPAGSRVEMTLTCFHGDMRRRDSDNQLSSILDTLVDAGILVDDSWRVVPIKHVYDIYDKGNPHCVVTLDILETIA